MAASDDFVYEEMHHCVDEASNTSKFYQQQIKDTDAGFVLFQTWGRIGSKGVSKSQPAVATQSACMADLVKQRLAKEKKGYELQYEGGAHTLTQKHPSRDAHDHPDTCTKEQGEAQAAIKAAAKQRREEKKREAERAPLAERRALAEEEVEEEEEAPPPPPKAKAKSKREAPAAKAPAAAKRAKAPAKSAAAAAAPAKRETRSGARAAKAE